MKSISSSIVKSLSISGRNASLAKLIMRQKWKVVEELLKDNEKFANTSLDDCVSNAVTEETVIHHACRFDPPLNILILLTSKFEKSLDSTDTKGRYALHVALKYGAATDIIRFLVRTNPDAAGVQDALGKTPMHYFAENYGKYYTAHLAAKHGATTEFIRFVVSTTNLSEGMDDESGKSPIDYLGEDYERYLNEVMLVVVKILKEAAPTSTNILDNAGENAIEYALESNAHISVIKTMQKASIADWRRRKSEEKGKRHEDLARDLSKLSLHIEEQMKLRQLAIQENGKSAIEQKEDTDAGNAGAKIHRFQNQARTRAARMA